MDGVRFLTSQGGGPLMMLGSVEPGGLAGTTCASTTGGRVRSGLFLGGRVGPSRDWKRQHAKVKSPLAGNCPWESVVGIVNGMLILGTASLRLRRNR